MDNQILSLPVLSAFLVFLFVLLRITIKPKNKKSISVSPPSPWKLPIIGNLHQMICSLPHRRLRDLSNKYGPLMHLQLGEVSTVVISSPELAKEVLKTHDLTFATRPYVLAAEILLYNFGDIGFAPYGEYWRQMRKICTMELLSSKRVQGMRWIREQEISDFVKSLSSNARSEINLSEMLIRSTYVITSVAAFGGSCKRHPRFVPLVRQMVEVLGGFTLADVFPSVKLFRNMVLKKNKLESLHQEVDEILESLIVEHRDNKKSRIDSKGEVAEDLVDVLLNIQERGELPFPLKTDNIKGVVLDIFLAGSETSSTTLEWAMSELMKNPRIMAKAQAEVRQAFDKKGGCVDEAGLEELEYMRLVIKETLRLHPPLPMILPRESRENSQILGYDIPVKTQIIVNAFAIARDPKYWTDAEKFSPERFVNSSIDFKGNNFEFLPFGSGRRICPGMSFGIANVELTLANLLYHFDWKLPNNNIKQEDLDMTESFGAGVGRKHELCLIPIPYHAKPVE